MTPQEVRTEYKNLPSKVCDFATYNFEHYPVNYNTHWDNPLRNALYLFDWNKGYGSLEYWREIDQRIASGEFDTPQPDDDTMISVSSRHYNDISAKADKYDRMAEIVKENAQNKKDEH